ncbi:MAG: DUF1987 domain-containing protein [Desulfosporosinus sp.]|nr:DUF1987 domain-containing protein [Desulfosporosinus sp.]
MEHLYIEATKATPEVNFNPDSKTLSIKGQSYPENAFKYFEPLIKWLDEFILQVEDGEQTQLELSLPYINTSSSKCIMMILEKFEEAVGTGKNIVVNWFYDVENESELECAMEFKEFADLEFNIIPNR